MPSCLCFSHPRFVAALCTATSRSLNHTGMFPCWGRKSKEVKLWAWRQKFQVLVSGLRNSGIQVLNKNVETGILCYCVWQPFHLAQNCHLLPTKRSKSFDQSTGVVTPGVPTELMVLFWRVKFFVSVSASAQNFAHAQCIQCAKLSVYPGSDIIQSTLPTSRECCSDYQQAVVLSTDVWCIENSSWSLLINSQFATTKTRFQSFARQL